jgi:hypothetical protein
MMKRAVLLVVVIMVLAVFAGCGANANRGTATPGSELNEEQSSALLAEDGWLPIGTVIGLDGYGGKVMIIGKVQYNASESGEQIIYDYSGVDYPQGLIDPKNNLLFDKAAIVKVYYLGYVTPEDTEYTRQLEEAKAELLS